MLWLNLKAKFVFADVEGNLKLCLSKPYKESAPFLKNEKGLY